MPPGRYRGRFGIAVIDHPAARASLRVRSALIVDIAEFVLAHVPSLTPGVEARIEALAVPPGKDLEQNLLHHYPRGGCRSSALWRCSPAKARHSAAEEPAGSPSAFDAELLPHQCVNGLRIGFAARC